jgi:hypothetical protein
MKIKIEIKSNQSKKLENKKNGENII